jgi:hypothetical protein
MVKNGQMYHYCINHKAWCIHTPAECHLKKKGNEGASPPAGEVPPPNPPNAIAADRIVINRAYQAILHDDSEDEG